MTRVGLGADGPTCHLLTAALSPFRSALQRDGERGCSQRETTWHLQGILVLKGAGGQLTGAEERIQGESFSPLPQG